MKRESKLLLSKAANSLILSFEHFNRPWDRGRVEAVLILLDHAFEMILKAAIVQRGGKIRRPREKQTLGFDECVRKALSDARVQFLTGEEALLLQTINGLRDAAYHHLIEVSEELLYVHAQAGLTLFKDLLDRVFQKDLISELPRRVLPISTSPPRDLATIFDGEVKEVQRLLSPGRRRHVEASARLRSLAIVESAIQGEKLQPGSGDLRRLSEAVEAGHSWDQIFPGVASIEITATGTGPSIDLRFTKKEGIPIHVVPEGTPGASVVGLKRVNELDFYNLGRDQLAEKVGMSGPKTTATIRHFRLQEDCECYKCITVGKTRFDRYSQQAIDRIRAGLNEVPIDDIWTAYRESLRARRAAAGPTAVDEVASVAP
jgi:hypothetical protein